VIEGLRVIMKIEMCLQGIGRNTKKRYGFLHTTSEIKYSHFEIIVIKSKVILLKQDYLRYIKKHPYTRISNSKIKLHPKEIK
jgi:hypothetical protein